MRGSDVAYLDTMYEVLDLVIIFAAHAQEARDDVMLDAYLKLASRSLRCALEMHGEHLARNLAEMQQGEKSGSEI